MFNVIMYRLTIVATTAKGSGLEVAPVVHSSSTWFTLCTGFTQFKPRQSDEHKVLSSRVDRKDERGRR